MQSTVIGLGICHIALKISTLWALSNYPIRSQSLLKGVELTIGKLHLGLGGTGTVQSFHTSPNPILSSLPVFLSGPTLHVTFERVIQPVSPLQMGDQLAGLLVQYMIALPFGYRYVPPYSVDSLEVCYFHLGK